jgi:fatty acid desaturase
MKQVRQQARRANVLSQEALQPLVERSDRAGISALALHLISLGLFCAGSLLLPAIPATICWLAYSIVLIFLFCPHHEVIHDSAFASRPLNRATGFILGLVLLLPPGYFRGFHMAHHRFTQMPGEDPELHSPKPASLAQYLRHISGIPYWLYQARTLLRYAAGNVDGFMPPARHGALVREARLYLLIYATALALSLLTGSAVLWWYWIMPALVGQPFLRLFLLAEHTGCPRVADMFDNTRTTLTNPLMRRLCWNMNFHTAHHAYAGIPFHRLPEANALLARRLRHVGQGYIQVNRDILRNMISGESAGTPP